MQDPSMNVSREGVQADLLGKHSYPQPAMPKPDAYCFTDD